MRRPHFREAYYNHRIKALLREHIARRYWLSNVDRRVIWEACKRIEKEGTPTDGQSARIVLLWGKMIERQESNASRD